MRSSSFAALCLFGFPLWAGDAPDLPGVIKEWGYPGATDIVAGAMVKGPFSNITFNTPDDPLDVIRHYEKKMGFELGNCLNPDLSPTRMHLFEMQNGDSYTLIKSASTLSHSAEEFVITKKTKTDVTTLVVLRVPKRRLTRVTITHVDFMR